MEVMFKPEGRVELLLLDAWPAKAPLYGAIVLLRALMALGDGGCCGVEEGERSRERWLRSVLSWICDCEEFLGLPRRKDPKIVVRVGGESFPGGGCPSIRAVVVVAGAVKALVESPLQVVGVDQERMGPSPFLAASGGAKPFLAGYRGPLSMSC